MAEPLGLRRIDLGARGGRVEFGPQTSVEPGALVSLIESEPLRYQLDAQQRLRITAELDEEKDRFALLEALVGSLGSRPDRRASA